MSQSAPIDVFQLATQGHTMGDARYVNAQFAGTLAYVIRRGFTFHGRVGSQNQFFHRLLLQQAGQRADTNFLRSEERRVGEENRVRKEEYNKTKMWRRSR